MPAVIQERVQCPLCGHRVFEFNPQTEVRFWINELGGKGYCKWYEREPTLEELEEVERMVKRVGMLIYWQKRRKLEKK